MMPIAMTEHRRMGQIGQPAAWMISITQSLRTLFLGRAHFKLHRTVQQGRAA
jgi:hypothetical protein